MHDGHLNSNFYMKHLSPKPFLVSGTPDALGEDYGMEIKWVSPYKKDRSGAAEWHHILQCMVYMWLTEMDVWYLVYHARDVKSVYRMTRNLPLEATMLAALYMSLLCWSYDIEWEKKYGDHRDLLAIHRIV